MRALLHGPCHSTKYQISVLPPHPEPRVGKAFGIKVCAWSGGGVAIWLSELLALIPHSVPPAVHQGSHWSYTSLKWECHWGENGLVFQLLCNPSTALAHIQANSLLDSHVPDTAPHSLIISLMIFGVPLKVPVPRNYSAHKKIEAGTFLRGVKSLQR